jgi:hypothetical protein
MPSFDAVSELNGHEVTNAVDQANRELKQMLDILRLRLAKRGVDVNCLDVQDIDKNLGGARQKVVLKHGIDHEIGKKIVKQLKDAGLKVQAQIQGDKVRVTGKKKDDLQAAIAQLRNADAGVPLQFDNFRD